MFCSNEDLLISIQDAANQVVNEYGEDVAKSVFLRFGATCAEDLNPSDYEEVPGNVQHCHSKRQIS